MTPPRQTAADFDPDVLRLFDQYVHGTIDRRGFLDAVGRFAGTAGAIATLGALSPQFASARQVEPDDSRIATEWLEFDSPSGHGKGRGYLVKPTTAKGPFPLVLVAHENRGLNPHIEDVARRVALAEFVAFAPDALFPVGGYPGDEDKARALFQTLDAEKSRQDFLAAARLLQAMDGGNGRVGAIGFCWGGALVNWLATAMPELVAGVPFYGTAAPLEAVPKIDAELLIVFAENDERVNATWPAYEEALRKAGVTHEAVTYPGTQHGFNNDTTPRYDEAAAKQAWGRMLLFLDRTLRVGAKG